jgi:hypothetical protein
MTLDRLNVKNSTRHHESFFMLSNAAAQDVGPICDRRLLRRRPQMILPLTPPRHLPIEFFPLSSAKFQVCMTDSPSKA